MKKLLILLIGLLSAVSSTYGKDYTFECSYKTKKYLAAQLGITIFDKDADQKIAGAFLDNYNRATLKIDIVVNNDGEVLFDGEDMPVKTAQDRIDALRSAGEQPIVLFIMGSYQKKSKKSLEKLMKSTYQLIEYREKKGIDYAAYPVLCPSISLAQKVWDLQKSAMSPAPTPSADEKKESDKPTKSQPALVIKPQAEQPKASEHYAVAEIPAPSTLPVATSEEYTVNVTSTLSVRTTPSANGQKIGSLSNGQHIQVLEISDGWAKILYMDRICYVKADYLEKAEFSGSSKYDYSPGFMQQIYGVLYDFMPFVILILAILILCIDDDYKSTLTLLLGIAELLFAAGNSEMNNSAVPWFCEPNKVGWIMTIIDFFLVCGVLLLQYYTYQAFMNELSLGCFGYLLSYPIMATVGFALCACLVDLWLFWAPIAAILIIYILLKWKLGDDIATFRMALWVSISFGGFLLFFLQTASLLIIGGLIWILLRAFAEGKGTGSSSTGGTGSDHSSGMLETSADGTPFVHHSDGTTTQLHDSGGGVMRDNQGKQWHKSVDGNGMSKY